MDMKVELSRDDLTIIADLIVEKIAPTVTEQVSELARRGELQRDEYDRKSLASKVLHCSPDTVDEYVKKGMPFTKKGKSNQKVFSRAAVINWKAEQGVRLA